MRPRQAGFLLWPSVKAPAEAHSGDQRCRGKAMMGILGWLLFGLIVGAIARLIVPEHDGRGTLVTILLGPAGGVLGGYAGRGLGWYREGEPTSLVMAVIGSVALLALYHALFGPPSRA